MRPKLTFYKIAIKEKICGGRRKPSTIFFSGGDTSFF